MPLARIDLPQGKPPEYRKAVSDAVYETLVSVLNAPENDRFQIICEHKPGDGLVIDPTYLGIDRSPDALIVQITLNEGRSLEAKKQFYRTLADLLNERVGLRKEDLLINLVEVRKENWSFGNGIAQYT